MARRAHPSVSRRCFLAQLAAAGVAAVPRLSLATPATDATFLFISDVHACRTASGLSPNCLQEGKTDQNLLRHIRALNMIGTAVWPHEIAGMPTGLASAGRSVGPPLGVVIGGDMTDDGGGQIVLPSEGTQLLQFSHRYSQGVGADRIRFPVYAGLGNHDLDQDGPKDHLDWYRRELRDYVEINHRPGVFFKPPVPADNYDAESDSYSWNWGRLHLVQLHRFGGDTRKGGVDALPWLKSDLAASAADGRPVMLFQHYGWDAFSVERWDPAASTFDDQGGGTPHWWSEAERQALVDVLSGYNVAGIFHGHQHETPMIYAAGGLDLFKPKAAYMGGFALARCTDSQMDVALGEVADERGSVRFTHALSKPLS